jgi:hypothetical protein
MNSERLKENLEDICSASDFFDNDEYLNLLDMTVLLSPKYRKLIKKDKIPIMEIYTEFMLKKYILNSHKRLEKLKLKFDEFGFKVYEQEFDYFGSKAKNCIFKKNKHSNEEIWIVGHHDYCAGLGANDDASAFAVMLGLAEAFESKPSEENLVFASFDLEELYLVGSTYYCRKMPKEEKEKIKYLISLECLGNRDISICDSVTFTNPVRIKSDSELVSKLYLAGSNLGYNIIAENYKNWGSDHIPFARSRGVKIKTASILSLDYNPYKRKSKGCYPISLKDRGVDHKPTDIPARVYIENVAKVEKTLIDFIKNEFGKC